MWQSFLSTLVGFCFSPFIHQKSQELIFEPPRIGNSSRRLRRELNDPIAKHSKTLVPQVEDGKSERKSQGHIAISKRRRSISSHNKRDENRKRARAGAGSPTVHPNSEVNSSSAVDVSSPDSLPVRKDVLERLDTNKDHYEKRPRHKTRTDKYDAKSGSKPRDVGGAEAGKRKFNKGRRKKSGLVMNSDFKAPNAAQDRLTLKANNGRGLFLKGKASSPVRRCGVPDLSFTEMNFLSKRQAHGESKQHDMKQARCSKSKEKEDGRTKQISEYFGRYPRVKSHLEPHARPGPSGQNLAQKPSKISIPSPANNRDLEKLPRATPNHGLRRQLALRQEYNCPIPQEHLAEDFEQPEENPYQRLSIPSSHHKQVGTPSSFYSWTVTSSGHSRSLKGHIRGSAHKTPRVPRLRSPHVDGQHLDGQHLNGQQHHVTKEHSNNISHSGSDNEPAHESPMSQSSLDHYTKSMLLGSKHDLWNRFPGQESAAELYSLNDLKCLARLDEFEVSHGQSPAPQEEVVHPSQPDGKTSCNHALEETDSHELCIFAGQKESYGIPRAVLNSGQHTSNRQIPVPISITNTTSRPAKADSKHDAWLFPPRLQYPGFSGDIRSDMRSQAQSRSTLAPAQPRKYPYFSARPSETPLGRTMSSTSIPAALCTHQRDNIPTRRTCSQPVRDAARQIIHDLEQEELLISQHHTQSHPGINNEDVADLAMEDISRPPSHPASPPTHHNHPLSHTTTLPPRTRGTHLEHAIRAGNHRSDNALCGDGYPTYQPRPSAGMGEPSKHPVKQHGHHHQPRKIVSFTTETRAEAECLGVLGDGMGVVEEEEEEPEGGRGHDDDEEFDLVGFWRPHLLY